MEEQTLDIVHEVAPEEHEERAAYAPRLTVSDGFRFGCGLILAGVAFSSVVVIALAIASLIAILFNAPLPPWIPASSR